MFKCIFSVLIVMLLFVSGCASMTFTQDVERPKSNAKIQHWHHTIINGMVEVSEPANLYTDCRGKPWQSAEVEFRLKNGLVGGGVNVIVESILFSSAFLAFYSPWNVEVECSE